MQKQVHVLHQARSKVSSAGLVPAKASHGLKASPVFDGTVVAPLIYRGTANSAIYIPTTRLCLVLFSSPPHLFQNKAFHAGPTSLSRTQLKFLDHSCNVND